MKKTIAFGCDHGGFIYKKEVIDRLISNGYTVVDCGTDSSASVDYPVFADKVCTEITSGNAQFGILICGTGIGMSICANKINGIRAAHVTDSFSARMTKMHNNSNVICLGGRITGPEIATDIVEAYMNAEFMGGRHQNRIDKVMELESK